MSLNVHLSNVSAYANTCQMLHEGPVTVFDLMRATGMHGNTLRKFVRALKLRRLIYVAVWRKDTLGRYTVAAYSWGSRPDAKRPPALTPTQRSANMRKRKALANEDSND